MTEIGVQTPDLAYGQSDLDMNIADFDAEIIELDGLLLVARGLHTQ